jgi:hypothetical protein
MMLDGVVWVEGEAPEDTSDGIPFATHEGVLEIAGYKLRCYRLNTGQAVFHADDVNAFFDGLLS